MALKLKLIFMGKLIFWNFQKLAPSTFLPIRCGAKIEFCILLHNIEIANFSLAIVGARSNYIVNRAKLAHFAFEESKVESLYKFETFRNYLHCS